MSCCEPLCELRDTPWQARCELSSLGHSTTLLPGTTLGRASSWKTQTTINLPDDLLIQIKELATETHSTVIALIEETLREGLARRRTDAKHRVRRCRRMKSRDRFPAWALTILFPCSTGCDHPFVLPDVNVLESPLG
ncbi:MAG TPA: hypothetical protein VN666_05540 [Nitrospira sp.]|nr:hypothetical protein [Nitrospira sp.]